MISETSSNKALKNFLQMASRIIRFLFPALLPLLIAVYPPLFHYGNNANIAILDNLSLNILFYCGIAVIAYLVALPVSRWQAVKAANWTFVFLIFFNLYGLVYNLLSDTGYVRMADYRFMPLFILLIIYTCRWVETIKPIAFWKNAAALFGILILFNLVKIIPAEVQKYNLEQKLNEIHQTSSNQVTNVNQPDVYFIIFDEMVGFDAMRDYWKFQGIDDFKGFLLKKGFFVAEKSRSSSYFTLHQMAERLNYQEYPVRQSKDFYYEPIVNNRVMKFFKSNGYSTATFDETNSVYPAMPNMIADKSFKLDSSSLTRMNQERNLLFDDFGMLIANNTMLRNILPDLININYDAYNKHQAMIHFTVEKISNLSEIPNPKFVHVHLLMPHYPFLYDENGNIIQTINFFNWNYYIGTYKYSLKLAEQMISGILANADPKRPPIIIFQSDHGARNIIASSKDGVALIGYPEEDKYHIVNALYLPGYDIAKLPQDMNPINTFPIIMNFYFNENIPLK